MEITQLILNNKPSESKQNNFNKNSNDKKVYIETFGCQMNYSD